ncbi:hypothetical protein ADUPG1_012093 [Aduncisulcus paluster]|uniref:Uncharacterized protein n=1 Tax=Aduncisulcus paluster TaxID=2918883 RepID=A0ABQ5JY98_9EUKA|nr:hypothetical protein ADUPG1_012093 [Aduncisulcus paluster]
MMSATRKKTLLNTMDELKLSALSCKSTTPVDIDACVKKHCCLAYSAPHVRHPFMENMAKCMGVCCSAGVSISAYIVSEGALGVPHFIAPVDKVAEALERLSKCSDLVKSAVALQEVREEEAAEWKDHLRGTKASQYELFNPSHGTEEEAMAVLKNIEDACGCSVKGKRIIIKQNVCHHPPSKPTVVGDCILIERFSCGHGDVSMTEQCMYVRAVCMGKAKDIVFVTGSRRIKDMCIFGKDIVNVSGDNPLRGENEEVFGVRFPDMSHVYNAELRKEMMGKIGGKAIEGNLCVTITPEYAVQDAIKDAVCTSFLCEDIICGGDLLDSIVAGHCAMKCATIVCQAGLESEIVKKIAE